MDKLIAGFTLQLEKAIEIASVFTHSYNSTNINNVLICGLGGSGIGATIISNILSQSARLPITVHKDYNTPAFVNEHTLVITYSYSGDTEETLNAYNNAFLKNAAIYAVSSGGKLLKNAVKNQTPHVLVPSGMPPRSCIGYAIVQILNILKNNNIIDLDFKSEIKNTIKLLNKEESNIKKSALTYATAIFGKLPIIYAEVNMEGVAIRFRQQLNENSKVLCWHHVIPEMNHNELVGWAEREENKVVILLRNSFENKRSIIRFEYVQEVISKYCNHIIQMDAKGDTLLIQSIYLIHLGDWTSYYLAELKKSDPNEVVVIDRLKEVLENK